MPLIKRFSGGGTVIVDGDTIFASIIVNQVGRGKAGGSLARFRAGGGSRPWGGGGAGSIFAFLFVACLGQQTGDHAPAPFETE